MAAPVLMNISLNIHFKTNKKIGAKTNKKALAKFKSDIRRTLGNKIKILKLTFISLPFRSLRSKTKGVVMRREKKGGREKVC